MACKPACILVGSTAVRNKIFVDKQCSSPPQQDESRIVLAQLVNVSFA
jgi:hypothetical protein